MCTLKAGRGSNRLILKDDVRRDLGPVTNTAFVDLDNDEKGQARARVTTVMEPCRLAATDAILGGMNEC